MNSPTRSEAQQRIDEIQVFQREYARLQHEGILNAASDEAHAIARYHATLLARFTQSYDIDSDAHAKRFSLGMRTASLLGALALVASLSFLFYQFWGRLSTNVQIASLLLATLSSFVGTMLLQRRNKFAYFTTLLASLSFACFVLNLFMLGQIFNLTPSAQFFLTCAALAFLLAYHCDLRLLLVAGIVCLTLYLAMRVASWGGLYWADCIERPENFFPAALLLFIFPALVAHSKWPEFPAVYRIFGLLTLFLPMLMLSYSGRQSYLEFDTKLIGGAYQVAGFVISGLVLWLGIKRDWPSVINTSLTFFIIFLYTKLYDLWWEILPKYLFFLIIGLAAVLTLLVLQRLRARTSRSSLRGQTL